MSKAFPGAARELERALQARNPLLDAGMVGGGELLIGKDPALDLIDDLLDQGHDMRDFGLSAH